MWNILLLLLFHFYFPYINYNLIDVSPDFLFLIILFSSSKLSKPKLVGLSFFIGLIKDVLTQYYFFGLSSFINSFLGYVIFNINSIKDKLFRYGIIFFIMFSYFFINYNFQYSESYIFYFKFSLIKSFLTFTMFFLFNRAFKKNF